MSRMLKKKKKKKKTSRTKARRYTRMVDCRFGTDYVLKEGIVTALSA